MCGSISKRVVSTATTILAFTPAQALACPVCALVGSGDNTWAYKAMSVMLIMLPLVMIGGAVLWLSRMAAFADAKLPSPAPSLESSHATAPAPGPPDFVATSPAHGLNTHEPLTTISSIAELIAEYSPPMPAPA